MNKNRRLIEVAFPVEEVSKQGRRDKNKRQITGTHIWWARRPLGPSRATAYAALVDSPPPLTDDNDALILEKHNSIASLAVWETAQEPMSINEARAHILESHDGKPPTVLDPFGGGGSLPLEAQRLGCETHSCDINPVAILIQKCTLEYPQKYGLQLRDDVKKWGDWVIEQATSELAPFYPPETDGSIPYAYIWARTLPCQNLGCGVTVPLMKDFWLSKKRNIALFPFEEDGHIAFRIVGTSYQPMPPDFNPANGSVAGAIVKCPLCHSAFPAKDTRRLFQDGAAGERMIAVVTEHPDGNGKRYRLATDDDVTIFNHAQKRLAETCESVAGDWGLSPVPDESMPEIKRGAAKYRIANYHFNTYGELFNARQQLALITFTEKLRAAYTEMQARLGRKRRLQGNYNDAYACAVTTCLGLWLNRIADIGANLCRWAHRSESIDGLFSLQVLPMIWSYAEANPLRVAVNRLKTVLSPMEHLSQMDAKPVAIKNASATALPYPDAAFDAVITDPPYYDNIAYSYLSDFFYVWLKRSVGHLHPELFETALTPKAGEIVAYGHRKGGLAAGKRFFEDELSKAFAEMYRVLKPGGIAVIVYAHKSTAGWETLINALLDSGLVITAAWPVDTEMKSRFRALDSAALASSIYMVARKSERESFGFYSDVKEELSSHLKEKFFTLWDYGISGAELFIAAIGSGLEVFGKYEEILDNDDTIIRADRMIADIREVLERLDSASAAGVEGTKLTQFYLRWRREHGLASVPFDIAKKLALSLGLELADEWGERSFIHHERASVRVLGPQERSYPDNPDSAKLSDELIDVLHHVLHLWRHNQRPAMIQRLARGRVGLQELIWYVAQAVSVTLPLDSEERMWCEGWFADRRSIEREVRAAVAGENR